MAADVSAMQKALSDIQAIVIQIVQLAGAKGTLSAWQKAEESLQIMMEAGGLAVDVAAAIPEAPALVADPVAMGQVVEQAVAMVQAVIAAAAAAKKA
jgi:hypothetical protein